MYSTYKIRQHSVKTSVTTHSKNLINCVGYCFSATLIVSTYLLFQTYCFVHICILINIPEEFISFMRFGLEGLNEVSSPIKV